MFAAYPRPPDPAVTLHAGAVWIDLFQPSEDEVRLVTHETGLHVPTLAELSEIENSSRLQRRHEALYLSVPTAVPGQHPTPVGFVLSRDRLITVRFTQLPAFEHYAEACLLNPETSGNSVEVFLGLVEGTVDRLADLLEREAANLEAASERIFHAPENVRHRPARIDRELRALLSQIGAAGDHASKVRDTLLGIGRVAQFVAVSGSEWISAAQRPRFETVRADIASLSDYYVNLSDKVQFLLDATLGFINIEQNNIIKVLTVVSIVGIPPTFVASLYGMNFKDIPELNWTFGYWYALGLMAVTAVLPLVWFRARGWL
jgi:magnesium transporter